MTQDFSSKVVGKKQMGLRGFRVCLDTTYYWKLKIKNWKYCKKIIFKCVNNIMRLIFNENFAKKEVCGQWRSQKFMLGGQDWKTKLI